MNKHTIFAFIGASGSGKSTIMVELLNHFPHLEIIKSTTTRPRRDEMDDIFYKFIDQGYLDALENQNNFLTHEIFADNHYIYEQTELNRILQSRCGMFAIIEPTVIKLQELGYDLNLIKIIPERDFEIERAKERLEADNQRSAANKLAFDLVVENSFAPLGLEKSIERVAEYISKTISPHTNP